MMLWNRFGLVALLMALSGPKPSEMVPTQRLCGSHLVDALYFVCGERGFFYSPKPIRELEPLLAYRDLEAQLDMEMEERFPHRQQLAGSKMKRGIVEQCCHNTCSLANLEGYCN